MYMNCELFLFREKNLSLSKNNENCDWNQIGFCFFVTFTAVVGIFFIHIVLCYCDMRYKLWNDIQNEEILFRWNCNKLLWIVAFIVK